MDQSEYEAFESSLNIGLDIAEEGLFSKWKEKRAAKKEAKKAEKIKQKENDLMSELESAHVNNLINEVYKEIKKAYDVVMPMYVSKHPSLKRCFKLKYKSCVGTETRYFDCLYFTPFNDYNNGLYMMSKLKGKPGFIEEDEFVQIMDQFIDDLGKEIIKNLKTNEAVKELGTSFEVVPAEDSKIAVYID